MSILQLTSRNSWTGLKPAAVTMAFNDRHYPSMALHPGGPPPRSSSQNWSHNHLEPYSHCRFHKSEILGGEEVGEEVGVEVGGVEVVAVVAAGAAVTTLSQWSCNKRPLFSCLYRSFIL